MPAAVTSRWHRSLFVEILLLCLAVALVSATAGAIGTAMATRSLLGSSEKQAVRDDARVYGTLIVYARTHASWAGIDPIIDGLAIETGTRIMLTDLNGMIVADSLYDMSPTPPLEPEFRPKDARAVVDAAHVDAALAPWLQDPPPSQNLHTASRDGVTAPSGQIPAARTAFPVRMYLQPMQPISADVWDLPRPNRVQLSLLLLAIVAIMAVGTAVLGARTVRPLRELASAARRASNGDLAARVESSRQDELGELAAAFNIMAARRQQLEAARIAQVSDISHELRTPLANIRGWIEAAEDGLVETSREFLSTLHSESLLLQRLIDDLHQLSVADAGELRLNPLRIDVQDFLEQIAASMRGRRDARGIPIEVDAAAGLQLLADPLRIRQVLNNLVGNALRYNKAGSRIVLRAYRDDGWIVISVSDTGIGIDPLDLPFMFDRFRRSDRSRNRRTGGSGLGLAIVRTLVEAHGGTAEMTSALGEGTTVRLRFPATARLALGAGAGDTASSAQSRASTASR